MSFFAHVGPWTTPTQITCHHFKGDVVFSFTDDHGQHPHRLIIITGSCLFSPTEKLGQHRLIIIISARVVFVKLIWQVYLPLLFSRS